MNCPVCQERIDPGEPICWSMALDGEATEFSIQVCKVDAVLCNLFPTLKSALMRSEIVTQMLRKAYGG